MGNIRKFKSVIIVLNIIFPLFLTACIYDPYYVEPPRSHVDFYPYDYYYYPSARVYFNFTTGFYYYFDNNRWVESRTLLPRIHLDPKDRVRIRVDNDKPFVKYPEHIKKYKPLPDYSIDKQRNFREREENRKLYNEYKSSKERKKNTKESNRQDRR